MLRWDHRIEDLTDHNITTETIDRIKSGNYYFVLSIPVCCA